MCLNSRDVMVLWGGHTQTQTGTHSCEALPDSLPYNFFISLTFQTSKNNNQVHASLTSGQLDHKNLEKIVLVE